MKIHPFFQNHLQSYNNNDERMKCQISASILKVSFPLGLCVNLYFLFIYFAIAFNYNSIKTKINSTESPSIALKCPRLLLLDLIISVVPYCILM